MPEMPGRHTWYNEEYNNLVCEANAIIGDEAKRDELYQAGRKDPHRGCGPGTHLPSRFQRVGQFSPRGPGARTERGRRRDLPRRAL